MAPFPRIQTSFVNAMPHKGKATIPIQSSNTNIPEHLQKEADLSLRGSGRKHFITDRIVMLLTGKIIVNSKHGEAPAFKAEHPSSTTPYNIVFPPTS